MSRELRHVQVSFVVNKPENLPLKDGEQMHADDVALEVGDVVKAAVSAWYQARGRELLAHEPLI